MNCSKSSRNQYFAAFSVNLLSLSYGASYAWISASYLQLANADTTKLISGAISTDDLGWVTASMTMGLLFASLFFGWLADRIGRKRCFLLAAIPTVLTWLLVATARTVLQLCVARFLAGNLGGCCLTMIPVYITELTDDRHRSTLGTFLALFISMGMLSVNILGYFFHYVTVAWILLSIPALFLATFFFTRETPHYLQQHGKSGVEKSLKYYRGMSSVDKTCVEYQEELLKPSKKLEILAKTESEDKLKWSDFTQPKARKAFFIGFGLVLANQLNGCLVMLKYTTVIFKTVGSSQSPLATAIIIYAIQLLGTYSATLFVERAGRKTLLIVALSGKCLGEIIMVSYYYLGSLGIESSSFSWVPVAAFALITSVGSVQIVDFIVIAEITPPKIRSAMVRFYMIIISLLASSIVKIFPHLIIWMDIPGVVSMFAVFSLTFLIFVISCVPETKGKSIEEIQQLLN